MKQQNRNQHDLSAAGGEVMLQKKNLIDAVKFQGILWLSVLLLVVTFAASLAVGRYGILFGDTLRIVFSKVFPIDRTWSDIQEAVVMVYRFPRTTAAIIIGEMCIRDSCHC